MKMDNSMKIRIALGLCILLGAGFISVQAADTAVQAAARSALIQMLNHSDDPPTRSLPATNTFAQVVVEQPVTSAATVTATVPAIAVTPQTDPVATTPVAAPAAVDPAAVSPAAVTPAVVVPAAVSPVAVAPSRSFLILSLLFMSLLLIVLLIMLVLLLKLRQLKLMLLNHPAVMASSGIRPAAAKADPSTGRREGRSKG
jgi:hypothetical protein